MTDPFIRIRGARQNNLRGVDLDLPLHELIVVTGVSGSGKSSLAFDTVYSEGQRRYVETFSPYARQFLDRMDKPQVDRIEGIPPAIAIDQTNPVRTSRSTVGTMTELNDHVKLLYARAARLFCRSCGREVRRDDADSIHAELAAEPAVGLAAARVLVTFTVTVPDNFGSDEIEQFLTRQGYTRIHARTKTGIEVVQDRLAFTVDNRARIVEALETALKLGAGHVTVRLADAPERAFRFSAHRHCAHCDIAYGDVVPNSFSFNSPVGACEQCRGFGRTIGIDDRLLIPDEGMSLADGAIKPWQTKSNKECQDDLLRFAKQRGVPVDVPWRDLTAEQRAWVIDGEGSWRQRKWYGVARFFAWLESKAYKMHVRVLLSKYRSYDACPACHGARLRPESLLWRLGTLEDAAAVVAPATRFRGHVPDLAAAAFAALPGLAIHDLMLLPVERTLAFFERLTLPAPFDEAAELVLAEIRSRLRYLADVGLAYLTLDRQSRTLSGGEVQRINLTTALGTSLVNTLFVLDEPSIGLHPRDLGRVVGVLQRLRDAGNTLLVVEHDAQVMLAADRIIDMGPGPGRAGGTVVFNGTGSELLASGATLTAQYLRGELRVGARRARRATTKKDARLSIRGATEHNLKDVDVEIPLRRLVAITGVSGSGKSTLVQDVLYNGLLNVLGRPKDAPGAHRAIEGAGEIADVVLVDQAPIGRTTRSNPASFVGVLEPIRKLFAAEPLARERKYTAGTFSFNSGNGRCPACSGNGFEHVEMQFLSDVYLRCPDCNGRRYRSEVLDVKLTRRRGESKSIADVLDMTVDDALAYFADHRDVRARLQPLLDVGLEYLTLGQAVPTLSGGEAQRLKLAGELAESGTKGPTLYLFDEPTTGLHFADVEKLVNALERLVAAGHSVVVIEHNLDVIAAADWVVDLGPEGGDAGGRVVAYGTPDDIRACAASHTGAALLDYDAARVSAVPETETEASSAPPETRRKSGPSGSAARIPVRRRSRESPSGPDSLSLSLLAAHQGHRARRDEIECLAARDELRQSLLAGLHRVANLLGVLRRELAHLGDDLSRALLVVHDGRHELLHGLGTDRGAVTRLQRGLLHLAADVGQILEALADALLHLLQRARALVQAVQAGERRGQRGQHRLVRAEERDGLLVHAVLRARGLHEPAHHDFRRVVADRQVVGDVLADLVAVFRGLHRAQLLVAGELELRTRHEIVGRRLLHGVHRDLELVLLDLERGFGRLQHLQRQHLGLLQRAAKVLVGRKDQVFALDLVVRVLGDLEIRLLDLVEALRDVAARGLHPHVLETLPRVDLAVLELLDHGLRVVTDAVERIRDDGVAVADDHRRHLLAHHLVEQRRLRQRAGNGHDLVLVEIGHAPQQCHDRRLLGLVGHEPEILQADHGFVEILHRCGHGD